MIGMRSCLLATSVAIVAGASGAAAQTVIPSAQVSLSGGYSTNPFLSSVDDTGVASAQIGIVPSLQIIDGTDQATISANYNRTEYLSKYDGNDGYGAAINASTQLNARTSLSLFAAYSSSILGTAGGYGIGPVITTGTGISTGIDTGTDGSTPVVTTPVITTPVIDDLGGDIGLVGFRQRRSALSAGVNGSYRPDEKSTWGFGANASRSSYPDNGGFASNFRSYGVNTSYSRSLSERSSAGFQVAATITDYTNLPDARFVTPRLTYNTRLAERWTLDLAAGVSIIDDGFGSGVAASASASLCRIAERAQFCMSASREPGVSGFGGARTRTSITAVYTYQLAEATSLSATGSYSRSENGVTRLSGIRGRNQDYVSGGISLNRRLARRLSAFGSVNYRDVNGLGVPIDADIGARAGLALTIGGRNE